MTSFKVELNTCNVWVIIHFSSKVYGVSSRTVAQTVNSNDVASVVGDNFKNVGVLSIESSLFHLFHYTFLQTKHHTKGY